MSCTVSISRPLGATALLPSPASSVRRRGWTKILPWRGLPSSRQPISDRSSSRLPVTVRNRDGPGRVTPRHQGPGRLEHLLTTLPAGDPAALGQAFVVLTAIIGLLTAGYAASLRRGVRRPECDTSVRLSAEDRNPVSRKGNMPVRSEN